MVVDWRRVSQTVIAATGFFAIAYCSTHSDINMNGVVGGLFILIGILFSEIFVSIQLPQ